MKGLKFLTAAIFLAVFISAFGSETPVSAKTFAEKAESVFEKASSAENSKKLYVKAARLYEKAAEAGAKNHKLYLNIGNCCFLAGDLGRAILNYRKAERLNPLSRAVQKNLSAARNLRLDKIDPNPENIIASNIFFWHKDFSLKTRFYAALLLVSVLLILLSIRLNCPAFPGFWPTIFVLVFLASCFGISAGISISQPDNSEGVITAVKTVARKGNGEVYKKAFETPLHSGTEFDVLEVRDEWLKADFPDQSIAWIKRKDCELF
ncbi:hypothetical protein L21SP3_00025 [Sedimentisphaera cyanobacteriorum]|uniref:Uncharacterized protein n=1 Tax=Sedimentisphaera cyanobacteriorum TaxID=1940790 RepID=A0A1Q2HKY7_9BACT|nr:tetratricopeptide repeat protein [Sedimentisphaera cyanobacteriorum]AQQ08249.1 hypothetical protein L21SP3_00025 [Sedimentisphaera cyanobacteriorum]